MKPMRLIITAAVLALLAQPAMAFKQTEGSPQEPAAAANDLAAQTQSRLQSQAKV